VVSFTPASLYPSSQWVGNWVGPRSSSDAVEKSKSFAPARNRTQADHPLARPYTDRAIQAVTFPVALPVFYPKFILYIFYIFLFIVYKFYVYILVYYNAIIF
jgi:hypothetical protein